MKGKNLVSLVKSLDAEEYAYVRQCLQTGSENQALLDLLSAIRSLEKYNRIELAESCGMKETYVRDLIPRLAKAVTLALGNHQPDQPLELDLQLAAAWKLVFRIQNGPATEVLQDLFDQASACDRFDILHEVIKLAEIMTVPAEIEGLSKEEVSRRHLNLLQFHDMKVQADKLNRLPSHEREALASKLATHPAMQSEQEALSVSARAHFHWIWKRIHHARGDYAATLRAEQRLIDLLEENRWLDRYDDFFYAKEHRVLVALLIAENRKKEAFREIFNLGTVETKYPLSTLAKWERIFPLKIAMSTDEGDVQGGKDAIEELGRLIASANGQFPDLFLTQNAYYSAYFQFTTGAYADARRTLNKLHLFNGSKSFYPSIFKMAKVLEVFLAVEERDFVEMGRLDKNFRLTKAYKEAGYFKFALGTLKSVAGAINPKDRNKAIAKAESRLKDLVTDPTNAILNSYFDLSAWLEAKKGGCTMSDIFRHRATYNPRQQVNEAV